MIRCHWSFAIVVLFLGSMTLAQDAPKFDEKRFEKQLTPPTRSAVKLFLDVEVEGVLSVSDKAAPKKAVSVKVKVEQELRDKQTNQARWVYTHDEIWTLDLDENLRKTAKTLHGKEVIVTGKCQAIPGPPIITPTFVGGSGLGHEHTIIVSWLKAK